MSEMCLQDNFFEQTVHRKEYEAPLTGCMHEYFCLQLESNLQS